MLFSYQLITENGGPITAFNGMSVRADASIAEVDYVPSLVVCSGYQPERYATRPVLGWLRKHARKGAQLGAIDAGCTLLARAGLLDGYRVTMHWEVIDSFREQFPETIVTNELFEVDRDRFSCAGGISGFEMTLSMIARKHGRRLAAAVADQFVYGRVRLQSYPQELASASFIRARSDVLHKATVIMEQNIEAPLEISEVSARVGVTNRHLERVFRSHMHMRPSAYYLMVRLRKARDLLQQTTMPVTSVAVSCGFVSSAHFSRAYRKHFGLSPRQDRTMGVNPIS